MASNEVVMWSEALKHRDKNQEFEDWREFVSRLIPRRPMGIRLGQFWYCELFAVREDLASNLTKHPGIDPFYNNKNIDRFLTYLEEVW